MTRKEALKAWALGNVIVLAIVGTANIASFTMYQRALHVEIVELGKTDATPAEAKQTALQAKQEKNPYKIGSPAWHEWNRLNGATDKG